jgi:hypothetical protein
VTDDDLRDYANDPIVRALQAPGTPEELAGELQALAAYRRVMTPRRGARLAGRFGAGATILVVGIGLSGGVAAAFGRVLPSPIQQVAHHLLGPVGVPAPHHHAVRAATTSAPATVTPSTTPSAGPAQPTTPVHHHSSKRHVVPPARREAKRHATATPAPTPDPTPPTPSPTPTAPAVAAVSVSVTSADVQPGATDAATARVTTSAGEPVPGATVTLQEQFAGESDWSTAGTATTDSNGSATIGLPTVTHNLVLRMLTRGGPHSSSVDVTVVPPVSVSLDDGTNGTTDVTVQAQGAQAGDTVELARRQDGAWQAIGSGVLDGSGAVTFAVTPPPRGTTTYRATLSATTAHGASSASFLIPAP